MIRLTKLQLDLLIKTGNIQLSAGTYCFPIDFSYDFGTLNVTIEGVAGQTIITSYDGTPATNFSPKELDTTQPDTHPDGLYVVKKHPYIEYGGGCAHLNLKGIFNTNNLNCFYVQGTILKKINGIWSRHYTGYGFKTKGNMIIKNIIFDNCQFYLFSPFGLDTTDQFSIEGCYFKNVSRVISSMAYAGVDMDSTWFTHLQVYPTNGKYRFKNFSIHNNIFDTIHTSIVWGFPPSELTKITNNTIQNSSTLFTAFHLFMKCYGDDYFFMDRTTHIISNNIFSNIITENGFTTTLIRTAGRSIIYSNSFLNVSPQVVYLYGGDSMVNNNIIIKKNSTTEAQPIVFLVKATPATNTFIQNTITAPASILVAVEGPSSTIIQNNTITSKIIYSRNQNVSSSGFTQISDNTITSPSIINIGGDKLFNFKSVEITRNKILKTFYLNTGTVVIDNFIYADNTLYTQLYPNVTSIKNLINANNKLI